jgi:chaperone required for assembly of F1-ATPase
MRDIFEDIFAQQPIDPMEAARRAARAPLKRRFYREAGVVEDAPQAFSVTLDGRKIRTPAGRQVTVPTFALAQAIADEWERQVESIDPRQMPLTRLVNSVIDGVMNAAAPVKDEIVRYLQSDLLFYRADTPAGLIARQAQLWDPILTWAREAHGARFMLVQGITFVGQPEPAILAMTAAIPSDPWRLGPVNLMTTLTGSALIALAVAAGRLSVEDAWKAAHVDQDWNMDTWGRDEIAMQRRAAAEADMRAAAAMLETVA